jgi:RecJ-like exonuclease
MTKHKEKSKLIKCYHVNTDTEYLGSDEAKKEAVEKEYAFYKKEEPKQECDKCFGTGEDQINDIGYKKCNNCNGKGEIPKQETLEEAATNYTIDFTTMSAFKLGAKWQAERMYSEEDMINFHKWAYQKNRLEECDKTTKELLKEWFKKYK